MRTNPETMELLRATLEKYVKDLAEELLYWVEELNKLDAGDLPGSVTRPPTIGANLDAEHWPAHRGASLPDEGSIQSPGKGA